MMDFYTLWRKRFEKLNMAEKQVLIDVLQYLMRPQEEE